jgi:phospholipid/cholesterol/gamma-HCH transport system substrate-binding protein
VSKSFRDRSPFAIGIASILAIILVVSGAFGIGAFHVFEHTFAIRGEFSDAAGVTKGAPVRLAGVPVGRVTSVSADRTNGRVIIRMVINRGVQLGPQTHAEVALATLLGAKYIRLSGKVVEPYLKRGAVIPNSRTATPYDVFELTKVATHRIEATDNDKLNTLIKQLAVVTDGKEQSLRQLIEGIAKLSTAVASRSANWSTAPTRFRTRWLRRTRRWPRSSTRVTASSRCSRAGTIS